MAYTSTYVAGDIGNMIVDVIGGVFNGLALNATTIGTILVFGLIVILAVDLLTGIFGIFKAFRRK